MSEKRRCLKLYPEEGANWAIVEFDKANLWDGNISEMEVGERMIVEVVEMTPEQLARLPEFQGW